MFGNDNKFEKKAGAELCQAWDQLSLAAHFNKYIPDLGFKRFPYIKIIFDEGRLQSFENLKRTSMNFISFKCMARV